MCAAVSHGEYGLSIMSVLVLLLFGVCVLGGLIALLVHRRTRVVGLILLTVPLLMAGLAFIKFWISAPHTVHVEYEREGLEDRVAIAVPQHPSPVPNERAARKTVKPASAEAPESPEAAETSAASGPEWLTASPRRVGGVFQLAVTTDPYVTATECQAKLPEQLHAAVAEYVQSVYLAHQPARDSSRIRLPLDYIRTHLVKEEYPETINTSVGPMVRLHARLEFDRDANARIDEQWTKLIVGRRLGGVAGVLAGVLLLLSILWGYLQIDLATQGAYRGRLRFLAALAILAVLAVGISMIG